MEIILSKTWQLRRIPQLRAALFWREERRGRLEAEKSKMSSCQTSDEQRIIEDTYRTEIRPGREEDYRAAFARLQEIGAEPVPPLAETTSILEKLLPTLSNLDRYETSHLRTLFKAMHELERLRARRAGEHVPAPVVADVNLEANGSANPERFYETNSK